MYKIETHLHTVYSSRCGHLDARTLIEEYLKKGYQGIIVTDHFNRTTCQYLNVDYSKPDHAVTLFLESYRRLQEAAAPHGMKIYKGAELRFDGSDNDYLLIGYPDWLLHDADRIFKEGLAAFCARCRQTDALGQPKSSGAGIRPNQRSSADLRLRLPYHLSDRQRRYPLRYPAG